MKISVIIPTLHREKDLKVLFDSFLGQTRKVLEIIIVDQSDNDKTKELCRHFQAFLPIKYFFFDEKSGSRSRNFGIKQAQGEVIAFLDDDTKLLPDYFEQVENFYSEYPDAIGGMSRIVNFREFRDQLLGTGFLYVLYKRVATFFCLNSLKKGFLVLPSGRNIDFYESEHTVEAEWLSTCNSWFRRYIFDEFSFEKRFEKWSFGEDRMLSHQIFKKYPGSLYFYPKAQLYHFESARNRLAENNKVMMKVIYQYWFFYRSIEGSPFFYWWANIGEILLHLLSAMILREPLATTGYYVRANFRLLWNLKKIKKGNFEGLIDLKISPRL